MPNKSIDLGRKNSPMAEIEMEKDKVSYPSLHIEEAGDYEFPDGDFEFTGTARKIASEEREMPDGSMKNCCTLEIQSITPGEPKQDKSKPNVKDVGEGLDESFETIAKKKADAYEEDNE